MNFLHIVRTPCAHKQCNAGLGVIQQRTNGVLFTLACLTISSHETEGFPLILFLIFPMFT